LKQLFKNVTIAVVEHVVLLVDGCGKVIHTICKVCDNRYLWCHEPQS